MKYTITSPVGPLSVTTFQNKLSHIEFATNVTPSEPATDLFIETIHTALNNYFQDPHYHFNLPLHLTGTPFQQKVWHALQSIPAGKTLTYGALATQLNTSARAIGNACRANPVPIIIPCHRIVAESHLGGYAGATNGPLFAIKMGLLNHEGYSR